MELPHGINLAIHVGAGVVGIGLGLLQLVRHKGDNRHGGTGRAGSWPPR